MKNLLLVSCIFIAQVTSIYAQKNEMPDKDLKEIEALVKSVSDKIETTLKKDVALYTAMKSEIERINEIKLTKDRNAAIKKYSSKYKKIYGQIVTKAGIDMKIIVSNLNTKYKNYNFTLINGFAILFSAKKFVPDVREAVIPTEVTTIPIKGFLETKDANCFGLGTSFVTFFDKFVDAETELAVIGNCKASGEIRSTTTIPADAKSIILKISGNTEASGYVSGTGGLAMGYSLSNVTVYADTESFIYTTSEMWLEAPFLWTAFDIAPLSYFVNTIDLTQFKGVPLTIMATATSSSFCGGIGRSSFVAKSTIASADLLISK